MKEKTLKKIKKLLEKEGVEEGKIDSIVAEIEATEEGAEDENNVNQNEEDATNADNPSDVPPTPNPEDKPNGDEQGDDQVAPPAPDQPTPSDVIPPNADSNPDTPAPGSIEDALTQLGANGDVPPTPTPTVDEVPPVAPPELDPRVQDLIKKLEESEKARVALESRVNSLEDALTKAGVIESDGSAPVGDERPTLPKSEENQAEDLLNGVLRRINGK